MASITPHTTRASGTILTAAIYNADHQVHVTNATAINTEMVPLTGVGTNGFLVRTGAGAYTARTLVAGTGIGITNANGVGGNPTISFTGQIPDAGIQPSDNVTWTGAHVFNGSFTVGGASTFNGTITRGTTVISTSGIFANTVGTILLRPNGVGSATNQMTYATNGNLVAAGNVTANSDEELKTDWAPLPADVIERVAQLKSGTYTRIDNGLRQVGVGAQSLQKFMPEAVIEGEEGYLAVAYGQAAMALVVELAKRVVELEKKLDASK